MSETTSVRVPAIQPQTASTSAAASTLPGLAIATASARLPIAPTRAPTAPAPAASRAAAPRAPAGAALALPRQAASASAAKPAVAATAKASAMPTTSSSPKERTIGIGESARAAKPAAVARQAVPITGPPRRRRRSPPARAPAPPRAPR